MPCFFKKGLYTLCFSSVAILTLAISILFVGRYIDFSEDIYLGVAIMCGVFYIIFIAFGIVSFFVWLFLYVRDKFFW